MSPRLRPPIGGRGEEDSDEREGVAPGGSVRTGSQWVIAVAGCCGNFVAQLSPGQASVETIPARRARESATRQRRATVAARQALRHAARTFRADPGGRTFGRGRWLAP